MSEYRTRNQLFLAGVETTSGTEVSLTPAANAIKARFPVAFKANLDSIDTDYVQSSLDQSDPIIGGGNASFSPACYLKGAGTAGTAPEWGPLQRGCGMQQALTAADVTGTAQGGSATSITLNAGASATDDIYKGMVIEITAGAGSPARQCITAYNGTTKVATVTPGYTANPTGASTFAIRANARYKPISVSLETLTLWGYQHHNNPANFSRRSRSIASAGSFAITVRPRGLVEIAYRFAGILPGNPDDVAAPAAPTYNATDPAPFLAADAYLGGAAVKFSELSIDLSGNVTQFDDPAAALGFDIAEQVSRAPAGRIVPNKTLIANRDAFNDWKSSISRPLWINWGPAIGKRVSILLPAIRYVDFGDTDVRGLAAEALAFRATGADTGVYICVW
jgi:hypothetical protein